MLKVKITTPRRQRTNKAKAEITEITRTREQAKHTHEKSTQSAELFNQRASSKSASSKQVAARPLETPKNKGHAITKNRM